jgi:integrase
VPSPKEYVATDGSKTWRVRFRLGSRATSETFTSKPAADLFCREVEAYGAARAVAERARRDSASDEYVPTLAEWYVKAMTELKTGITDGTRADYDKLAGRVMLPMLGSYHLDQIDRAADAAFIKRLETTPRLNNRGNPAGGLLSPKTIRQHHGLLSDLLNMAVVEQVIPTNPCRGARLPRAGEQNAEDARFLTHPEWAAIYDALPAKHRALPFFLVGTGLRWSEATALQVKHVDLDLGTVRVVQAWKKPKKGGTRRLGPPKSPKSRRTVMLAAQVVEALRPLVEGQPPEQWVFRAARGGTIWGSSYHYRVWAPACAKAQVEPRPRLHDLRHTHASWLIEQGATLEQVQDQLGHESILTTRKVYGSLQPAMRAKLQAAATAALDWSAPAQIEA